jgi:hypothetical protein
MASSQFGTAIICPRRISLVDIDAVVSARLGPTRGLGYSQFTYFARQVGMYLTKHVGRWSTAVIGPSTTAAIHRLLRHLRCATPDSRDGGLRLKVLMHALCIRPR